MTVLVDSVGPDEVVDNEAVENAFSSAARTKSAATLANYAMCMVRIRQSRFNDAKTLLASAPEATRRSPAFLRLRLWLSLQTRDQAAACQAFDALIDRLGSDELSAIETRDTCVMLAGTVAMLEGVENNELGPDRIARAKAYLAKIQDSATLASLRTRGSAHREVSKLLNSSIKEALATPADANESARDAAAEKLASLTAAYAEAKQTSDERQDHRRNEFKELTDKKKELGSTALKLKKDEKKPTSGHPGPVPNPPQRPQPPIEPTPPLAPISREDQSRFRQQQDQYRQQLQFYQQQLNFYQGLLAQYEKDATAYPEIVKKYQKDLAAWIKADQDRRDKMKQDYEQAIADRKQAEVRQKEMGQETAIDQEQLRTLRGEIDVAQRKLAVLKAVTSKDVTSKGADEVSKSVFVPANFPLLDLTSEQRRLAAAWKKIAPKPKADAAKSEAEAGE